MKIVVVGNCVRASSFSSCFEELGCRTTFVDLRDYKYGGSVFSFLGEVILNN